MKTRNIMLCLGLTSAALIMASNAHAYKAMDVTNGGSISGKITFNGTAPANPTLQVTKDKDLCGSSIPADYYIVGAGGGLKNVVIAIENIDKGKAYDEKGAAVLDNKDCMFAPHVTTAVKGKKLGINNSDPVLHNTHLYQGENMRTMYNLALPLQNRVIKKKMKKDGIVTVKCDAHEWMLGYVYVAEHPYATVSAADGSFTLKDVPPGDYNVKIWHEKLGEKTQAVSVTAGGTATLNSNFTQ